MPFANFPNYCNIVQWGNIKGTINSQADLNAALNAKADKPIPITIIKHGSVATNDIIGKYNVGFADSNSKLFGICLSIGLGLAQVSVLHNGERIAALSQISVNNLVRTVKLSSALDLAEGDELTLVTDYANDSAANIFANIYVC